MIRFYSPDIEQTRNLPEGESAHCVRVLRKRVGDRIEVVDGKGHLYRCVVTDADPRHTGVEVEERILMRAEWSNTITIAISPPKNSERMDWLVEKLVEIGVDRLVPVRCDRSERKSINAERLRKIAISAMKQSLKAAMPQIEEMTDFATFLAVSSQRSAVSSQQSAVSSQRFIAYCEAGSERQTLISLMKGGKDTAILIGPEGDFSPEEVAKAKDVGWQCVSLGERRLRTETAALVGCDMFHFINEIDK